MEPTSFQSVEPGGPVGAGTSSAFGHNYQEPTNTENSLHFQGLRDWVNFIMAPMETAIDRLNGSFESLNLYVSGWVETLLKTSDTLEQDLRSLQSELDAIKEQKPTAPAPLSFRQLIELHHLQIISRDEIRSLLRVPEALAETNQQWTSLFTFDSEPKTVFAGLSLVDVVPTTEVDNQAVNEALNVLYPPSPPEPDL